LLAREGRVTRRTVLAALVLAAISCRAPFVPVTDPLRVRAGAVDAGQLESSVQQVPEKNMDRIERLRQLFQQAGCGSEYLEVSHHGGTPYPNVICTLPGRSPYTIVVGANVDKPPDGKGVVDNWTGAAMLPHLYRSLAASERQHSFLFIGFGHVLKDEQGSRGYLRRLGAERRDRIRAMVNLKGLGLGPTSIWSTQADRNLRQDLHAVAKAIGLPLEQVRFFRNVNADSEAFLFWGIPSITITSYTKRNAHVLEHPIRDRDASQLDLPAYYDSARLLSLFLAYLDDTLRLREERGTEPPRKAS
jgi:hypothetical protein